MKKNGIFGINFLPLVKPAIFVIQTWKKTIYLHKQVLSQTYFTQKVRKLQQTFIDNRTNGKESFDSHHPFGLTRTGTASSQSPTPLLTEVNSQ